MRCDRLKEGLSDFVEPVCKLTVGGTWAWSWHPCGSVATQGIWTRHSSERYCIRNTSLTIKHDLHDIFTLVQQRGIVHQWRLLVVGWQRQHGRMSVLLAGSRSRSRSFPCSLNVKPTPYNIHPRLNSSPFHECLGPSGSMKEASESRAKHTNIASQTPSAERSSSMADIRSTGPVLLKTRNLEITS